MHIPTNSGELQKAEATCVLGSQIIKTLSYFPVMKGVPKRESDLDQADITMLQPFLISTPAH